MVQSMYDTAIDVSLISHVTCCKVQDHQQRRCWWTPKYRYAHTFQRHSQQASLLQLPVLSRRSHKLLHVYVYQKGAKMIYYIEICTGTS
jgi:hypothetical protein